MRKSSARIAVVTSVILMTGVLAVVLGLHNRLQNDTPIPFLQQQGSTDLRGELTILGQKNSVPVIRVTFSAGTSTETLTENRIYLVTVPDDQSIASVPLDQVIKSASGSNQSVNYFGYQYTSADAAEEKANRDNADFHARFPGVFFASTKALQEDAAHGNTLENFAARNNVTFTGALLRKNSQYFVVVNETGDTSFSVHPPVCGDGIRNGVEECDDGKQCSDGTPCEAFDSCVGRVPLGDENLCLPRNGDGCTATCQSEVAVTFGWVQDTHINPPRSCSDLCALESGRFVRGDCAESSCPAGIVPAGGGAYYRTGDTWRSADCSYAVGVSEKYCCCSMTTVNSCGDGFRAGSEQCDDGNQIDGDGCSIDCQTETGYACTGSPSVCTYSGNILRISSLAFTPVDVQSGDYSTGALLTARLENVGPFTVTNAVVTMPMPPAILNYPSVLSLRSAGEGTTCSLSGGQLSCNLGDLQAGETKSLALLFDVNILNNPYCINHATISAALSAASDTTDPVSADNNASTSFLAGCPVDFAFVSAHFDPGAVKRGSNPTLNLIVKNYGPVFDEKNVYFDTLPADFTFVNPQSTCWFYYQHLRCHTGPIAPGQTKNLEVDFHIAGQPMYPPEVPMTVNLSFEGGRPDSNPDNDTSRVTVSALGLTAGSDLDIGVLPPQQQPDLKVYFPVRVHNYGLDAASSIVVSHTLTGGATFYSATGADCSVQGDLLTCNLAEELAGASQYGVGGEKTFGVTLQYPALQICGQSAENRETFSVTNAAGDINPLNDTYTVFFQTACQADFGIVSAQFDPASVPSNTTPPSTTTLSVNVENSGSSADDAYVKIFWSNGNYFSAMTLPPYCDTDWDWLKGYYTKCWTGIMSPGESKLFTFTYHAVSGLICQANVPLTVDVSLDGQGNDQNWNNNTTQANVTYECPQQ